MNLIWYMQICHPLFVIAGLDIPSCNFVIRYSFVSNEIGDVQAKGRARMPNAKRYSLIVRGELHLWNVNDKNVVNSSQVYKSTSVNFARFR